MKMRMLKTALAVGFIALGATSARAQALPPDVLAIPGSFSTTYATPIVVVTPGSKLDFINLDLQQHNVFAKQNFTTPTQTPWCCDPPAGSPPGTLSGCPFPTDGCPLFYSPLVGIGTTAIGIQGVENLPPGQYDFACQIHPGMFGTLIVLP